MASKSAALMVSLSILFFFIVLTSIPSSSEASTGGGGGGGVPANCPPDALKLNVCADVLRALVLKLPAPQNECCSLVGNLIKLDAAACLCTSLRLNVLNLINLNTPVDLSLLLNYCKVPAGFKCA